MLEQFFDGGEFLVTPGESFRPKGRNDRLVIRHVMEFPVARVRTLDVVAQIVQVTTGLEEIGIRINGVAAVYWVDLGLAYLLLGSELLRHRGKVAGKVRLPILQIDWQKIMVRGLNLCQVLGRVQAGRPTADK